MNTPPLPIISAYLDVIANLRGVRGAAACNSDSPGGLIKILPPQMSAESGNALLTRCLEMLKEYHAANRSVRHVVITYAKRTLLIVSTTPVDSRVSLAFVVLIDDHTAIPAILSTADALCHPASISPAPFQAELLISAETEVAEDWTTFLNQIRHLLQKVVASAQAEMLIKRILAQLGADTHSGIPAERYSEFALSLLLEIPNRARQESLRPQIAQLLQR